MESIFVKKSDRSAKTMKFISYICYILICGVGAMARYSFHGTVPLSATKAAFFILSLSIILSTHLSRKTPAYFLQLGVGLVAAQFFAYADGVSKGLKALPGACLVYWWLVEVLRSIRRHQPK